MKRLVKYAGAALLCLSAFGGLTAMSGLTAADEAAGESRVRAVVFDYDDNKILVNGRRAEAP